MFENRIEARTTAWFQPAPSTKQNIQNCTLKEKVKTTGTEKNGIMVTFFVGFPQVLMEV